MKEFIVGLWVFIVMWFCLYYVFDGVLKTHEKYEERIGDRVILDGDTLRIINYRFMGDEFILEDGRSIHMKLIEKLEVVK